MCRRLACFRRVSGTALVAASILPLTCGNALAGGFELRTQGASGAGTATAGAAAIGEDATMVFYNPAAMTLLDESQVAFAGQLYIPDLDYDNRAATDATGGAVIGSDRLLNEPAVVPSLFGVWNVSDRVRLGFGLTSPFGLATEYDEDWAGKYNTYYTSLQTFDFNPAIAVRVTDWLSAGAGVSVQYARADRRNKLDFGSICFNSGLGSGTCTPLGLLPQAADGRLELTADDWSVGYNVGILLQPTSNFRVGLAYRSRIHQRLEGTADFTVPGIAEPLTAGGAFQDTAASAEITLPERASLSLYYEATPQLALLGDVTWTGWSRFDALRVDFDNPAQPSISEPEEWDDSFRYSIGARYQATDEWVIRVGLAYDETPIDSDLRNPGIPGNDRLVFALGTGYRLSDAVNIDFAYTYNRELEASIDQSRSDSGTIEGDYNNSTHLLTAQAVWRF